MDNRFRVSFNTPPRASMGKRFFPFLQELLEEIPLEIRDLSGKIPDVVVVNRLNSREHVLMINSYDFTVKSLDSSCLVRPTQSGRQVTYYVGYVDPKDQEVYLFHIAPKTEFAIFSKPLLRNGKLPSTFS